MELYQVNSKKNTQHQNSAQPKPRLWEGAADHLSLMLAI